MTVRVKVVPRSSKSEVVGELGDGTLKVKVAAPAEKGKANSELIAILAVHFGVARSAISIVSGHSTPWKLVRIG